MITKGGQGSGITGHRTIRDAIAKISPKAKKEALEKLKAEQTKRSGTSSGESANPQGKKQEALEDVFGDLGMEFRIGLSNSPKLKQVGEKLSKYIKLTAGNDVSSDDAAKMAVAINKYAGSLDTYRKVREGKEPKISEAIESLIEKSQKFDGQIYRGMYLKDESFIKGLKPGGNVDLGGFSSWSSDKKHSLNFTDRSDAKYGVIFKMKNKSGASITHLSKDLKEKEVLVSGKSKLVVKSIIANTKGKKTLYEIEMEESFVKSIGSLLMLKATEEYEAKDSDKQISLQDKWKIDSELFNQDQSKQIEDLINKIIIRVKEKLNTKEVSKEDWIQAWKDDPHWDKRTPSKLVNRLLDETDKKKVLSILELGCGNGVDSIAFGGKGHNVIGIDISPDAIKLAKKNNKYNNVTFEVGDAENLKYKDDQFDLVYSMAVLHSSDLKKSISELSRVLKAGGKALLFLYQKTEYEYNDETEENFKFKEIEGLFAKNNLKVLSKDKTEKKDKDENGIHWHYSVVYVLEKQ